MFIFSQIKTKSVDLFNIFVKFDVRIKIFKPK